MNLATGKPKWKYETEKYVNGAAGVHKGNIYFGGCDAQIYCIDAETGETRYTSRLPDSNWATPIGIGDNVFVFCKDGSTAIVKAGPEKQDFVENRLWVKAGDGGPGGFAGEIQYGAAPTTNGFVVRTGTRLFLVGAP